MAPKQTVDPTVRQAIERISAIYKECFNKGDAAGVAGIFTKDGVLISQSPEGPVKSGTEAIVHRYEGLFKSGFTEMDTKVSQVAQVGGDVAIAWGEYQFTGRVQGSPTRIDGTWSATYVRDTGAWKCRLLNAISKAPASVTK
jgi:uncharacterized protein (TIGR02246 family)